MEKLLSIQKFKKNELKFRLELIFILCYTICEVDEMETTSIRLKQIMKERNLRQVDILRLAEPYCGEYNLKLTKSDMSQFVSGKVEPGQWKLAILGRALNVSEVWLMGYDVPMKREDPAPGKDAEREEFVRLFTALPPENRQRILDLMKALLSAREPSDVHQE